MQRIEHSKAWWQNCMEWQCIYYNFTIISVSLSNTHVHLCISTISTRRMLNRGYGYVILSGMDYLIKL